MGLDINGDYVAYTFKHQLNLKDVSNEAIAECFSAFFLGSKLDTSVEILNLTLHKVLKNYQGDKSWTEREEKEFRDFKERISEHEAEGLGFTPDNIEF